MLRRSIFSLKTWSAVYQLFTFLLFLILPLRGDEENLIFKHLTSNNGLSQNTVLCILQDRKGFMWFGTKDGLNRYDGYSFTVYRNNPFDAASLSANYITALFEDRRGFLWIGTLDGVLNRMLPETETFQHYKATSSDSADADPYHISAITEDLEGNIWIATTGGGLLKLANEDIEADTASFTKFVHRPGDSGSLSDNTVNDLLVDSNGVLWAATNRRLDQLPDPTNGGAFQHHLVYTKDPVAPATPIDSSITAIYEGREGILWLGTISGLVRFDPGNNSLIHYPHKYHIYRYGWGRIWDILEDHTGRLWLATPALLMRFDPTDQTYDYFSHDPLNPQSISQNGISSLLKDQNDALWFGTSGYGIDIYDPRANRFPTLRRPAEPNSRIAGFSIRSILEDKTGSIWLSSEVLYHWDRQTGELKSFETNSDRPDDFGNTGAWSMLQDRSGLLWFATSQGLYRYESETGRVKQYKFNAADTSGLPQKEVYTVFESRDSSIWIATENYFSKLIDMEKGRFHHFRYRHRPGNQSSRPPIYQDGNGQFWIGTDDGLLRFNSDSESFHLYHNDPAQQASLSNNFIKSICPDPDAPQRFLWVGTAGGGLNRFDMAAETFRHFTEKDGLPNNVVYGILPDEKGDLWLSTNRGLSRFNRQTAVFRNYETSDGLQSDEFNTGAFYKSQNGEMFFGGINGLNYFYPEDINDNPVAPPIIITDFKIFNRSVSLKDSNSVLLKVISQTDHIILPYKDNVISFEFTALDYHDPSENQYAYELEGFNQNWIQLGTRRTVTFTNLDPGEYTLHVRGSNSDGIWNEAGISLKITITPPPWRTWWAYGMYLLAFLGIIYGARRYELNRIRLKNRLELEQIESNSLRQLDQMKSRFFANLSHEFRTPLTLILGPIERLISEQNTGESKRTLRTMQRNAVRLLKLINQLLDLSKLDAGKMELRTTCDNLIPFLKGVVMSYESLAEMKNICLTFSAESEVLEMYFDPDKIEKIFYNLLSNAFKFTPEGGSVIVDLRLRIADLKDQDQSQIRNPKSEINDFVEIMVKDSGIGIPPDRLANVFNRFYQVDDSALREQEGTGIGLALVKELVELHQGIVVAQSEIGKGSTFTVILPLGKVHLKPEQISDSSIADLGFRISDFTVADVGVKHPLQNIEKSVEEFAGDASPLPGNEQIVLIVEDNADVRAYIRQYLRSDYQVVEAHDGEEGVEKAQEIVPDLVISDLMMPKMDGYQLCKTLKTDERTSHIPVILLTARATQEDKLAGLETGADDYLTKPFDSRELQLRVKNLIAARKKLRERFSAAAPLKTGEIAVTSVDRVFLKKIIQTVEAHIDQESFGVEDLCNAVAMSERQLRRKIKALTDQSPIHLIRSLRLQRARQLLEQNAGTVSDICYMVGFSSLAYFTKCFREQFGKPPSEFINQS